MPLLEVLTISQLIKMITIQHPFIGKAIHLQQIAWLFHNVRSAEGDATTNPAAGIGTPLKPKDCELSILNLASRHAPAAGNL